KGMENVHGTQKKKIIYLFIIFLLLIIIIINFLVMCFQTTSQFYENHAEIQSKLVFYLFSSFSSFHSLLFQLIVFFFNFCRIKLYKRISIRFKNSGKNIPKEWS